MPNAYLTAYINRPVPLLLFANSTNIQHVPLGRKDSANIPFTLYYANSTEEESSAPYPAIANRVIDCSTAVHPPIAVRYFATPWCQTA